ncbi:hypothetical protein Zmor_011876, partial [Zophobas morio]
QDGSLYSCKEQAEGLLLRMSSLTNATSSLHSVRVQQFFLLAVHTISILLQEFEVA